MLLASEKGASLIVSVGAHFNLVEFLDKQRSGMSSTFLTRLRIGETLVDAKGVSRLYNPGLSLSHISLFFAAFAVLLDDRRADHAGAREPGRAALAEDQGRPWAIAPATTRPRWRPCSWRSRSAS